MFSCYWILSTLELISFCKIRGYFAGPVDEHLHFRIAPNFPKTHQHWCLVPKWLHIIKYPETASQSSGAYAAPATLTLSQEKKRINLWLVQVPHITGFRIRQTTTMSVTCQWFILGTLKSFIRLCRSLSQRLEWELCTHWQENPK